MIDVKVVILSFNTEFIVLARNLPGITETLKSFFTILLGNKIMLYTDDMNLTHNYKEHDCESILNQRKMIKEYVTSLKYIKV